MQRCFISLFYCFLCKFCVRRKVLFFLRSEEQNHSLTKKSIITQRARALTLNSEECGVYHLILPSRVDSACTSFFGRAGSVGSQQFSFATILTWCQFWLVSIMEIKNCSKILAKKIFGGLRLKLTEKYNATLAKTQKDVEKLPEKCKAVFVFYFVGFT